MNSLDELNKKLDKWIVIPHPIIIAVLSLGFLVFWVWWTGGGGLVIP